MRAPASLRVEDYPLTGEGTASDIFPWPRVRGDRNLRGPGSVAVPGVVAGTEEAYRRHARLAWRDLLAPSVALAGEGLAVDWWTALYIGAAAAGIMWFDPTPGNPNSLAPGKRCLTNYTPVVAQTSDGKHLVLGASGGRRILPCVTQLLSFVMDYAMTLDAAIDAPRIDTSEGEVVIGDVRLPDEVHDVLRARFDYEKARLQTFPGKFASPSIVLRQGTSNSGATEVFHAWGDAVAENHS